MSFDLRPSNKKVSTYCMGSSCYFWMMDNGVGMVVGYGKGIEPGSYIFHKRKDDNNLMYNDGAKVTAREAKEMSKIALRLSDYQDMLYNEFEKLDEKTKKEYQKNEKGYYNLPIRRDFVENIRAFSEFAQKSGGFRVY